MISGAPGDHLYCDTGAGCIHHHPALQDSLTGNEPFVNNTKSQQQHLTKNVFIYSGFYVLLDLNMKVVCSEPYVQCTKEANVLIYLLTTLLWAHTLSYISLI